MPIGRLCIVLVVSACSSKAPPPEPMAPAPAMPSEETVRNAATYRACTRYYNERKWNELRGCYAADVVQDEPGTGKPWIGPNEAVKHLRSFVYSFPDNTITPALTLVSGVHAVSIMVLRGTNSGPFPGAAGPTNKPVGLAMAHLIDFDTEGKIVTEWILYDTFTLHGQLELLMRPVRGILAEPASPATPFLAKGDQIENANLMRYQQAVDAFNAHDPAGVREQLAEDLVWSEPNLPEDLSKAEVVSQSEDLWRGFSNLKRTPTTAWAAGDYVAASGRMTGKNDGVSQTFGANATGRSIDATYIEIARYTAGKRDRSWLIYNGIVVAQQLGMKP